MEETNNSRRKFIQQSAVFGAGMMLAGPSQLFEKLKKKKPWKTI